MFSLIVLVIVVIGGCFFCTAAGCITFFRVFIRSRTKVGNVLTDIRFLPEKVVSDEVENNCDSQRNSQIHRAKRKSRIREAVYVKGNTIENACVEAVSLPIKDTKRESSFSWLSIFRIRESKLEQTPTLSSATMDIEPPPMINLKPNKEIRLTDNSADHKETTDVVPFEDLEIGKTSDKSKPSPKKKTFASKRFISQNRLQRTEARQIFIKPRKISEETGPIVEPINQFDRIISLLNVRAAKAQQVMQILEKKKLRRTVWKQSAAAHIAMQEAVVKLNAGPPAELLPRGYTFYTQEIGEALLTPEVLLYKRVLYLWETEKAHGWFLGTIASLSETPGFNYRIKYDRHETKSLIVDRTYSVALSLQGENAYGRRWVILQKIVDNNSSRDMVVLDNTTTTIHHSTSCGNHNDRIDTATDGTDSSMPVYENSILSIA